LWTIRIIKGSAIIIVSNDDLILEEQLSFIMYACSKETIKRYKSYLEKIGLTYTQYLAMLVLWNGDNIPINELGKRLYLDSGTITPLLKRLETKELIERIRDINDERNVFVRVTPKGYKLKESIKTIPEKVMSETGIPVEEANDILEILKSVLERVNQK
jgi:MarR family transcriptional regulator, organic hydroperoxide resistance regulator